MQGARCGWMGLSCLAILLLSPDLRSEPAPIPMVQEDYEALGPRRLIPKSEDRPFSTVRPDEERPEEVGYATVEFVQEADAAALRLHFADVSLGPGSSLTIRSLIDNAEQTFTAEDLDRWNRTTAIFNGPAVEVVLDVVRGDTAAGYEIAAVERVLPKTAEEAVRERTQQSESTEESASDGTAEARCGPNDDRVPSSDPRVGRIVPVGCTGWLAANGAVGTAGHCVDEDDPAQVGVLEFNVPASNHIGVTRFAHPKDQYEIDTSTIVFRDQGEGNDWAFFCVRANEVTGLYPLDAQGEGFDLVQGPAQGNVRIIGFGVDNTPPSRNQTQQMHTGAVLGTSGNVVLYIVDTEKGNSGSLVTESNSDIGFVIHTHGGCNEPETTGNKGTAFQNEMLWTTLNSMSCPR